MHDQIAAMLSKDLQQLQLLVHQRVVVAGTRRGVCLFASSDYEALCVIHDHKGPKASMPCLWCYGSKAPSATQAALDAKLGTL